MITKLSGTISEKKTSSITVDVGGVGYGVAIPLSTFCSLPELGEAVSLFIHTNVREDAIQLFGFMREVEREAFRVLIAISGVGPKVAIAVLSGISVENLASAVQKEDSALLEAIPGIGKKTAQRIVLELKGKFKGLALTTETGLALAGFVAKDDALSALMNLGYKEAVAKKAIEAVINDKTETPPLDIILRDALKVLAG